MYEVGEILLFPQFLSTTPDLNLAQSYAKGVFLKINVAARERALNIQEFLGSYAKAQELLFARNRRLRVLQVIPGSAGKSTVINAELIP